MSGPLARCRVCQHNVLKTRASTGRPYYQPCSRPSFLLSIPPSLSKWVKCLKRCIEVSVCAPHDGYVIWHNASKGPSQIKWQMLFFASWFFFWPGWFWDLKFCSPILFPWASVLFFSLFFFYIYCDLTKPAILFFIEFHRLHYCIIASDRESMAVDVSLSFITDTQPSALFSVGV